MNLPFEFATPTRALFGSGKIRETGSAIASSISRCVVFTGSHAERASELLDSLDRAGISHTTISTQGEPTFDAVRQFTAAAKSREPDGIIGMGGVSVLDTAKAVAMLIANGGDPLDYAEVIGAGKPVARKSLPFVAIPTTAGAGAEATKNAVLIDTTSGAKVSLRSHLMLPELVIIDPQTTISLPPGMTASTGMDALAQLIEPFVSVKASPLTDALCRVGIALVARSLERACADPSDLRAREDMSLAAWWSGMALANAGLGAVHGFAAALGGVSHAPHGLICARFLAPVCRANIAALRNEQPDHPTLLKYAEAARLLAGHHAATPDDLTERLTELTTRLPLQGLVDYGVDQLPQDHVINAARKSSSMKGNPTAWPDEIFVEVYMSALKRDGV